MKLLVCIKRVPLTGGRILLTDDAQDLDTKHLGFTISPHEECGVEEAVRLVEANGGESVALCLGPAEAVEQLRETMALGIDRSIHLVTAEEEWDPQGVAGGDRRCDPRRRGGERTVRPRLLRERGCRQRELPGRHPGGARARATGRNGAQGRRRRRHRRCAASERREPAATCTLLALPAVVSVKEGLNLPRFPSVPAKIRAQKKPVASTEVTRPAPRLEKLRLVHPEGQAKQAEILGEGAAAAPRVVELLRELGVA